MANSRADPDSKLLETDRAWAEWGLIEPYYSVLTDPKYRLSAITPHAKREFFESGQIHADGVIHAIRNHVVADFRPVNILDFGCGVGRLVLPFAKIASQVVGLDVSPAMRREAQKNCREFGVENVRLLPSDDNLSAVASETFDLVHSAIVFQHIPKNRGKIIFRNLLNRVAPGGVVAIQLLYSKIEFAGTDGVAPEVAPVLPAKWYERTLRSEPSPPQSAPEMQMNPYNMNELLFFMQTRGVRQFHSRFTDHGGEMGLWLYFQL